MIISNQIIAFDIKIRESILTKVSTVKFFGVTLDENLNFNDLVIKVTSKISKSFGVMSRLHCQLPANVMVKLYVCSLFVLTYDLLAWRRSGRTNAAKIRCGRVGRVTDCGVRGLGFKSPGSILTSRTETSSPSRVVRDGWDPCSVPLSG